MIMFMRLLDTRNSFLGLFYFFLFQASRGFIGVVTHIGHFPREFNQSYVSIYTNAVLN